MDCGAGISLASTLTRRPSGLTDTIRYRYCRLNKVMCRSFADIQPQEDHLSPDSQQYP